MRFIESWACGQVCSRHGNSACLHVIMRQHCGSRHGRLGPPPPARASAALARCPRCWRAAAAAAMGGPARGQPPPWRPH